MTSQREASKQNWNSNNTIEEINSGSLQRIADATELMAKSYVDLQRNRDMYKNWYEEEQKKTAKAYRTITALRGANTKLLNKISLLQTEPTQT